MAKTTLDGAVRWYFALCNVFCMTSLVNSLPVGAKTSLPRDSCSARGIAIYNMTFQTFWSRDLFPKQYPTFRPHAQWSRVLGRTHSTDYGMWKTGGYASPALTEYAQTGQSELFDLERQGHSGVFDVFGGGSINSGVGKTTSAMFMDAAHPQVSVVAHLIPSPDWFVGLDSESLCSGDQWVTEKTIELRIWDAGTDKGYTFTAPNWAEVPQKTISEITASSPNNVACGFYYPGVNKLPAIAQVTFTKDRQVDRTKDDELQRDWHSLRGERVSNEVSEESKGSLVKTLPSKSHSPEGAKAATTKVLYGVLSDPVMMTSTSQPQSVKVGMKNTKVPSKPSGQTGLRNPVNKVGKKPKLSKEERRRLRRLNKGKKNNKNRKGKGKKTRNTATKTQKDVDCHVSEWAEWSPCSKTCGFGNRSRMRTVEQASSGRGNKCPALAEEELCGTMRGCGWNYFSNDNWGSRGN